jgi:hypothetical protein
MGITPHHPLKDMGRRLSVLRPPRVPRAERVQNMAATPIVLAASRAAAFGGAGGSQHYSSLTIKPSGETQKWQAGAESMLSRETYHCMVHME